MITSHSVASTAILVVSRHRYHAGILVLGVIVVAGLAFAVIYVTNQRRTLRTRRKPTSPSTSSLPTRGESGGARMAPRPSLRRAIERFRPELPRPLAFPSPEGAPATDGLWRPTGS